MIPNELLSYAREQRHWTQEDIAESIGAPDAKMVGKWERGIVAPSPHYRQKLEALFGKSGRELGFVGRGEIPFWSVPYRRNLYFTGREVLLSQLHTAFDSPRDASHVSPQLLSGLGGTGKSQLALEYAYRYRHEYHTVRGQPGKVENFYQQALAIQEVLPEPKHLDVAALLNDWGELYFHMSQPALAEPIHMRALTIRKSILPGMIPD